MVSWVIVSFVVFGTPGLFCTWIIPQIVHSFPLVFLLLLLHSSRLGPITNTEQLNLHQQSVSCLIFSSQTQNHTCSLSLAKLLAARTTGRTAYDISLTCDWSRNASVLSSFNCAVTHEPKEWIDRAEEKGWDLRGYTGADILISAQIFFIYTIPCFQYKLRGDMGNSRIWDH